MKKLFVMFVIPLLFSSCSSREEDRVIASFHEKDLLLSDVIDDMPNHIDDSVYFVEKFMNDWIRKELMITHAELNLSTDLLKYEKQIEDYRASLLIYEYQQELLNQNFDTAIALSEIEDYYEQYKDELKLSKNIFKGRFIVVDKLAPNLNLLDKLYKSEKETAIEDLEDYCQQFSKEYFLEYNKWQYFSIFNNKLPDLIDDEESFLRNTKGVFFENETFRYYIFIKDYQIKGSRSPLAVERDKIKDVLLNKKKIKYLKQLEDELYQNALVKKKIKIY
ncbi:MAG: hypothetical protein VX762_00120 [Bacteroidota bacterium]|nr:hypothetical protein [Bacteroidota bacterium]